MLGTEQGAGVGTGVRTVLRTVLGSGDGGGGDGWVVRLPHMARRAQHHLWALTAPCPQENSTEQSPSTPDPFLEE